MHKSLSETISDNLQRYDFIVMAILFGSYAEGRETLVSDVDLGIYTNREVSLLELGLIVARLEGFLKRKVDLIILNDLYKKRPVLAFEIVSHGKVLFCRNPYSLVEFKKSTFLYYLDTKPLREKMDSALRDRLKSGHFGERRYA